MPKIAQSQPTSPRKKPTRPKQPAALPRPAGKLGVIVDLLARQDGASAAELMAETGWQPHSVRGALSRLRTRGFLMHVVGPDVDGTRSYQLDVRVAHDDAP